MKSEGEKVNWDEKARDEARETYFSAAPTAVQTRMVPPFVEGARWQRDQLRTDEAVERVAGWLCEDDHGYTLAGHGEWCQDLACDLVESCRESARDLITALIGEEP